MSAAREGKFGYVVCLNMDRYSRDDLEGKLMLATLTGIGITLVLTNSGAVDPNDDTHHVLFSMLGTFADYQRRSLLRTMANGAHVKARDSRWPCSDSAAPFGLKVVRTVPGDRSVLADSIRRGLDQSVVAGALDQLVIPLEAGRTPRLEIREWPATFRCLMPVTQRTRI
jgi:Resolvase, N terminal domain